MKIDVNDFSNLLMKRRCFLNWGMKYLETKVFGKNLVVMPLPNNKYLIKPGSLVEVALSR